VVEGDNFTRIAKKNGVTLSALEVANPGVDSNRLRPGQKIKIPARETASAQPPVRRGPTQPGTAPRNGGATPPRTGTATPPPPPTAPR
jgi:LysM repeat protein